MRSKSDISYGFRKENFVVNLNVHLVSMGQELNPIMNFAVTFLKMRALYVLWRAQSLSEFYAIFCSYQILIL